MDIGEIFGNFIPFPQFKRDVGDLYNKYALYLWFNGFKACIASFFALPLSVLQCFLSQTYSMFMLWDRPWKRQWLNKHSFRQNWGLKANFRVTFWQIVLAIRLFLCQDLNIMDDMAMLLWLILMIWNVRNPQLNCWVSHSCRIKCLHNL